MASDLPLYNSRIFNTYIKLINKRYPYISISDLLSYAKMELYQVEDEGHWFTQEQSDLFYEKLLKLTGNANIAREAGRYAASPESIGVMRQYILSQVDPATAYEMLGKATLNFTRSSIYEPKRLGPNKVEIFVTPKEGVEEKPYQCENRLGYIDAISLGFRHRLPRIEHPECLFKDGKVCRYVVSWEYSQAALWKKIRNYTALGIVLASITLFPVLSTPALALFLAISVFALLLTNLYIARLHTGELNAAIEHLRDSTEKLVDQIDTNYNNMLFVNEIGQILSRQMDIDGVLTKVIQRFEKRLDYDRGMIMLISGDKKMLTFRTGFGYSEDILQVLRKTSFHVRPDSKGVFIIAVREKKPFLINDVDEIWDELSPRSLDFARRIKSKSFICCPIVHEDEALGLIAVDNLKTKRPLVQSDISLLMGIAQEIGISLHNASLMESKLGQFQSILQTLAASIDARDPLTAGHSERVTEYAVGICNEMGMSKEYCEMIRVASLLHDYGKIGIRDSILKKNGMLDPEERREIETHAEKTKKILEQISFEGYYQQVPEIAGSHHERYDGSGYPLGLKGEEIPLGARIIAVADCFEAVTSKRHYRDPMPMEKALGILNDQRGLHFDTNVVDAFLRFLDRKRVKTGP